MISPIIISASRSTDIPAFYSDWFMQRLNQGHVKWINPFNHVAMDISLQDTRLIVFWSKNPRPMFKYLDDLKQNFYFQFTLNDYDKEGFEPGVPPLQHRIETFLELSERIGSDRVIWRFDPLILTDKLSVNQLLEKIETVGDQLKNHTNKLVFSFLDFYKKIQHNLQNFREFTPQEMHELASGLQKLNSKWNLEIVTCSEKVAFHQWGIHHNKCIDDDLIIKLFSDDKLLMDFLGVKKTPPDIFTSAVDFQKTKNNKDPGQRKLCGCIVSKDIGQYNTCPHLCKYCYANSSKKLVIENWKHHVSNPNNDAIL